MVFSLIGYYKKYNIQNMCVADPGNWVSHIFDIRSPSNWVPGIIILVYIAIP